MNKLVTLEEIKERLAKAGTHKYMSRAPDGKGGWNYNYAEKTAAPKSNGCARCGGSGFITYRQRDIFGNEQTSQGACAVCNKGGKKIKISKPHQLDLFGGGRKDVRKSSILVKGSALFHKYKSRKPDGKGGYIYEYDEKTPREREAARREAIGRSEVRTGAIHVDQEAVRSAVDKLLKYGLEDGVFRGHRVGVQIKDAKGAERIVSVFLKEHHQGGVDGAHIASRRSDGTLVGERIELRIRKPSEVGEYLKERMREVLAHELAHAADPSKIEVTADSEDQRAYFNQPHEVTAVAHEVARALTDTKAVDDLKTNVEREEDQAWHVKPLDWAERHSGRFAEVYPRLNAKNQKRLARVVAQAYQNVIEGTVKPIEKSLVIDEDLLKARKLHRRREFAGMKISVENQAGSFRHWFDPHANESGKTKMLYDYGYILRTEGTDGDHIDVYIGPDVHSPTVYAIDQAKKGPRDADRWPEFDEQKIMLGFGSEPEARRAYLAHYNDERFLMDCHAIPIGEFKRAAFESKGVAIRPANFDDGLWQTAVIIGQKFGVDPTRLYGGAATGLSKGETRGGKYVRRVPYTDGKGRRRYRYYYRETASARDAREGETVRLGKRTVEVEKVHDDGTITIKVGKRTRDVTPRQWHEMLAKAYGPRFHQWALDRATRTMNAVLKHVPREVLADLKGTDAERLSELRVRVPKVYAKLSKSFSQAGVSPFRAKQIIGHSLERKGWAADARAVVLGSVLDKKTKATNFEQLVRTAENISGGWEVTAEHAAAAAELRAPGGSESGFPADVERTSEAAEGEMKTLSKLIEKAKDSGDLNDVAKVLAASLGADAMHKLSMMLQAFPGMKNDTAEQARATLQEVPSIAPSAAPKRVGSDTILYVAGEGGQPKSLRARYRLMNASEIRASHDPLKGFKKHEDYPEGVQERAYHRDQSEQGKVIRNAQKLKPAFVVNTNPDAVNGPPMITPDGIALGGNSRTMSMQVAYANHPEKAAEMKSYLRDHAHEFGLTRDDVEAMESPILVREVQPEGEKHTKEEMKLLVRQMNESFTQGMDPRTMQVAMGRKLDDDAMKTLANGMREDETLNDFLSSSRADPFINMLYRNGVIDDRNSNQYMKKGTRQLNEDGKFLVARILVGRVVGDADLLSATRKKMVDNIAAVVPLLTQARAYGKGFDLNDDLAVALSAYNDLTHRAETGAIPALDPKMTDKHFTGLFNYFDSLFGDKHPVVDNKRASKLLEVLIRKPGPNQISKVFRDYVKQASQNVEGQGGLFGGSSPTEVFDKVMSDALTKSMFIVSRAQLLGRANG